jgi:hypothetical protein
MAARGFSLRIGAALLPVLLLAACSDEGTGGGSSSTGAAAGGSGGGSSSSAGGAGGAGGGSGSSTGGAGGGAPCAPGSTESCYSGPPQTQDVGTCKAGVRTCNAEGTGFGPCEDEVLPAPADLCTNDDDEDCSGSAAACTGATVWSRRFGNNDMMSSSEQGLAAEVDAAGYTVIAGQFLGTLDFGPAGVLTAQGADVFVAKIDPTGVPVWARWLDATNGAYAVGVAIDPSGNIAVVGHCTGGIDAGGGMIPGDSGNWNVFLASYDAAGDHRFSDVFGSSDWQVGRAVAAGSDGSIAITGDFRGSINFGGDLLNATGGSHDLFVARFDANGGHIMSKRFGDAAAQEGQGVAIDAAGDVIVSGYNNGTIDLGGGPLTSAGLTDIVVAKLDGATGDHLWSKQFGSPTAQDGPNTVAIDAAGDVFLATYSPSVQSTSVDFGGGPLNGYFFLAKLGGALGAHLWSRGFDGLRGALDLSVDPGGAVVIAGSLQGTVDFGGGPLTSYQSSYDIFVAKYEGATGAHVWSRAVGDSNQQANLQQAAGVGTDALGFIGVAGSFSGAMNFGDGEIVSGMGFGGQDVFVARLEP